MSPEEFGQRWRSFAAKWLSAEQSHEGAGLGLIDALLKHGIAAEQFAGEPHELSDDDLMSCEMEVLRRSNTIDVAAYRGTQPRLKLRDGDAVRHFCQRGWRAQRNPSHNFDVWWYQSAYAAEVGPVNPLLHFVLLGRFRGHAGLPELVADHRPVALSGGALVRRACLFVGSDLDGVIDPVVVRYVQELNRFADVYYLSRTHVSAPELEKLAGITAGAWASSLDEGDTATAAFLASQLVGWSVLEQYDEVVIANDRRYLLRPLDEVFESMDAQACDWWTLRVTSERFSGEGPDREPIGIDQVRRRFQPRTTIRRDEVVGFDPSMLAFRRPVIADEGFRRMLEQSISGNPRPAQARRQEMGLASFLPSRGYVLSAFDELLRPHDQPFGPTGFELAEAGYPLLDQAYLATNPDEIPDLGLWKTRLAKFVAGEVLNDIEAHLLRTSSDADLQRSFAIVTGPDGVVVRRHAMTAEEFRAADLETPKFEHWWAFPVCAYDHTFAGNERAVFEEVRDDPSIKKIVLTRSRRVEVSGENVVIVPIESPEGQRYLLRSRFVFVKHTLSGNVPWPMSAVLHDAINLWHGIPLKRFGVASTGQDEETRQFLMTKQGASRAVVASSKMDMLAMAAAFFPVSYPDLWPTGLPRNDFITCAEDRLPADLRATLDELRDELAGRRLVMFLPTFRDGQGDSQYQFSALELARISEWAEQNNAVIGVREHMADKARTYSTALAPLGAIDLSSRRFPDLEVLYRAADALISDYSSCLVDFLLTGKPVLSFAYDYDRYNNSERGLFYELDRVLPGPVCRTFEELAAHLDTVFDEPTPEAIEEYDWKRRIFFDHLDDQASWRVVQKVKALYLDGA